MGWVFNLPEQHRPAVRRLTLRDRPFVLYEGAVEAPILQWSGATQSLVLAIGALGRKHVRKLLQILIRAGQVLRVPCRVLSVESPRH